MDHVRLHPDDIQALAEALAPLVVQQLRAADSGLTYSGTPLATGPTVDQIVTRNIEARVERHAKRAMKGAKK